ncbi:MAG: hypothetical protein LAC69_06750 [Chlorobium sp.]|nr:hypothetical protein [Chlorobium sp.]
MKLTLRIFWIMASSVSFTVLLQRSLNPLPRSYSVILPSNHIPLQLMKAACNMQEQRLYPAFVRSGQFNAKAKNTYHSHSVTLYEAE